MTMPPMVGFRRLTQPQDAGPEPAGRSELDPGTTTALVALALFLVVAIVTVYPALRVPGAWPVGHDTTFAFARSEILAEHLRNGDLFPVWSSSDAYGLGTPSPLYYHKLLFYVAAAFLLLGLPLKGAVAGTLIFFLVVGMVGMRLALLRLNVSSALANIGAIALAWSSYTFTDWLVRGALPDFAAMMLVPWLLWWALGLVIHRRFGLSVVPVLSLMYLAHNVIALLAMVVVAGAVLVALIEARERLALLRRAAIAGALVAAFIGPQLRLNAMFSPDYDINQILPEQWQPKNQLRPFGEYFLDRSYNWTTNDPWDYTVCVGWALWVALAAVLVVRARGRRNERARLADPGTFLARPEMFLLCLLTVYMAVQTPMFVFVYEFSYLRFVQFPWRSMALVTPVLILLVLSLAHRSLPREARLPACSVLLAGIFAASPILAVKAPTFDVALRTKGHFVAHQNATLGNAILVVGEYLPVVHQSGRRLTPSEVMTIYSEFARRGSVTQVLSGVCRVEDGRREFEGGARTFAVDCAGASAIALPVSYNRFSTVTIAGEESGYRRLDDDPRLIVDLPAGTRGELRIELPTLRRVVPAALGFGQ